MPCRHLLCDFGPSSRCPLTTRTNRSDGGAERGNGDGTNSNSKGAVRAPCSTRTIQLPPLRKLSPAARARFVRSLQFNERGLTSADTRDLVAGLSAADVYRVLRLFGAQHLTTRLPGVRFVTAEDQMLRTAFWRGDDLCNIQTPDGAGCTGDYPGYYCEAKGTCKSSPGYICTRNCRERRGRVSPLLC